MLCTFDTEIGITDQLGADSGEAIEPREVPDACFNLFDGAPGHAGVEEELLHLFDVSEGLLLSAVRSPLVTEGLSDGEPTVRLWRHGAAVRLLWRTKMGGGDADTMEVGVLRGGKRTMVGGAGGVFVLQVGENELADVMDSKYRELLVVAAGVARVSVGSGDGRHCE